MTTAVCLKSIAILAKQSCAYLFCSFFHLECWDSISRLWFIHFCLFLFHLYVEISYFFIYGVLPMLEGGLFFFFFFSPINGRWENQQYSWSRNCSGLYELLVLESLFLLRAEIQTLYIAKGYVNRSPRGNWFSVYITDPLGGKRAFRSCVSLSLSLTKEDLDGWLSWFWLVYS